MATAPSYNWERLWFPVGSRILQSGGYLPDPASPLVGPVAHGAQLESLKAVPCLILLGIPGIGKTSEMRRAAELARSSGGLVDFVPLARFTSADAHKFELVDEKNADAWAVQGQTWTVFLDGLDEALAQLAQIEKAILDLIRELAKRRGRLDNFRLRISCRSAEWPLSLETELRSLFGNESIRVLELGQLLRRDVTQAAAAVLAEPQLNEFTNYLDDHEAAPLASRPITLEMLLNVFQQDGALPTQQVQLYRRGLLALIEESNATRRRSLGRSRLLDNQSKLLVSARIAASCIFSNNPEIWVGLQSQAYPPKAVVLSEIAGGYEPGLTSSFPVSEVELSEVLLTALFVPVLAETFGWAHQTFAEFLAAYYLAERRLTADEMLNFLRQSAVGGDVIPPQLTEVAAWLASMRADFFNVLISSEPAILLRSDVAAASAEDKERLVHELLGRFDREELHDFDFDSRSRYKRLYHPRLNEQLRPYIADKSKNIVVRRVAIDIAEATGLADLESLLIQVALDTGDDIHVRAQATAAISRISSPEVKLKLKDFVTGSVPEDVDDELKGYALRALWPEFLTIQELLSSLTPPKNESLFGAYALFIIELEVPPLSSAGAISVLNWLAEYFKRDRSTFGFDRAIPRLFGRVFEASANKDVRENLVNFILSTIRDGSYWTFSTEFQKLFPENMLGRDDLRRELINSIIDKSADDSRGEANVLLSGPVSLLTKDDLRWLVDELSSERKANVRSALIDVVVAQVLRQSIDDTFFVWQAAQNNQELTEALSRAYSCELGSAASKWQKEDFEARKRRSIAQDELPGRVTKPILDDLSRIEEQSSSIDWWKLNLLFFADQDGRVDGSSEFTTDLTKSNGWALLSERDRHRIIALARRYLIENRIRSSKWLGASTLYRPGVAGYRALRLLFSEAPDELSSLDDNVWKDWTAWILGTDFDQDKQGREVRSDLARKCYAVAQKQVFRVAKRLITRPKSEYDVRELIALFEGFFDELLGNFLWTLAGEPYVGEVSRKPIVSFLVSAGYTPAIRATVDALNNRQSEGNLHFQGEGELIPAAAALLQRDPKLAWPSFCVLRERDEGMAIKVISEFGISSFFNKQPFYVKLSESQLADLFEWLYRAIPPRPAQRDGRARFLSAADHVEHLRQAILQNLVHRGTAEAVRAVGGLATRLPELDWLKWQVVDARRELAAKSWKILSPSEAIAKIASYSSLPSARSTAEILRTETAQSGQPIRAGAESALSAGEAPADTVALPLTTKTATASVISRWILAVGTEWSSGHGGLSTFNRELCVSLAAAGHRVACLTIDPSSREISEANAAGVRLIGCPSDPTVEGSNRLLLFDKSQLSDFAPEIVFGHDHITGSAAFHIASRVFDRVPYVHFIHTLPEEIEIYKGRSGNSILRGNQKAEIQFEQCKRSQLVVCVGPKIFREMATRIAPNSKVPVVDMRPGLDRRLLHYHVDLARPRSLHCLFLGRLEDGDLKGAKLACQMIRALNLKWPSPPATRPSLVMRGFDPDNFTKEIRGIGGIDDALPYLIARPYTPDAETIANDIRSASIIIMPSKREGFGLVAMEGIAAGIPILITAESGVAEMLSQRDIVEVIGHEAVGLCIADVDGDSQAIETDWASRVHSILSDPAKAFSNADRIREALKPIVNWEKAALNFSSHIETIISGN